MRLKLSDMPDALRRRVEVALAKQTGEDRSATFADQTDAARAVPGRKGRKGCCPRGPNKTEAEYNRLHLRGKGLYEAVTLRLPGGSRYTPDWVVIGDGGTVELHEVKGAYRFGSHGRAATAFREAVAAFPCFAFVWAVRGKGGAWSIRRHAAGLTGDDEEGEKDSL